MVIKKDKVDVVMVGLGWIGFIMGMELIEVGLNVLVLECGDMCDINIDMFYLKVVDELKYFVCGVLFQDFLCEIVMICYMFLDVVVFYCQYGFFLLGDGVGGVGFYWNGMMYCNLFEELEMCMYYEQKYGKKFIFEDMIIQDYGVIYKELEFFYDFLEKVMVVFGKVGNFKGQIVVGGNLLEGECSDEFLILLLQYQYSVLLVEKVMCDVGYYFYLVFVVNVLQFFINLYGVCIGFCNYCGFCENYGCYMYFKVLLQIIILLVLLKCKNFEVCIKVQVIKVNLDVFGKCVIGVIYIDVQGCEVEQFVDLVLLIVFQIYNVCLLLFFGIGKLYDLVFGEGVVGKNFVYQYNGGINVVMFKGMQFNFFIGIGVGGVGMDDFNVDQFDYGLLGFIGGVLICYVCYGGCFIKQVGIMLGEKVFNWGFEWKVSVQDVYQCMFIIGMFGLVMVYCDCYLLLDLIYKDVNGQLFLCMILNWKENEGKMLIYIVGQMEKVGQVMNLEKVVNVVCKIGLFWDMWVYQLIYLIGGVIMGMMFKNSVVNKYL